MYQFVFGFINIQSSVLMWNGRYAPPCVSVNSLFASDLTFVYALIIGLLLTSKSQNMIIILEFPNGKNVN